MQERSYDDGAQPQPWPTEPDPEADARRAAAYAQWGRASASTPWWRRHSVQLVLVAVIAAGVGIGVGRATGPGGTSPSAGAFTTQDTKQAAPTAIDNTSSPITNQGDPLAVGAPSLPPTSAAPAAPQQVTYSCTGSAPDGVDITYGPVGSNHSASHLPFTHTDSLDASAQYYVTTAQLSGSGSVSCTTTVQTDNADGSANQVTKTASADGGYNIASAQVCSTFNGGWQAC